MSSYFPGRNRGKTQELFTNLRLSFRTHKDPLREGGHIAENGTLRRLLGHFLMLINAKSEGFREKRLRELTPNSAYVPGA